ncbi:MAG: hypothetical protein GY953_00480 [bacterium]|nr:hypothetical protein [bacterium]
MNLFRNAFLVSWSALLLTAPALRAQEEPLLPARDAAALMTRAVQLVESTSLTVPGLARAAAPVLENSRQALANLKASSGGRHSGHTYEVLANVRAYQALADSLPRPYPFPEAASRQFAELRANLSRLESHFDALLDSLEHRLRHPDRDNLRRYGEQNARLASPSKRNPRVVFLGDSITDGWRLNEYFPDKDFLNRGISGQTTGEMLGRMQADVINLKPAVMLVLAGTNDIARGVPLATIKNNLTMIAVLAKANNIRLVFASILPIHDYNQEQNPRYLRSPQRPPRTILDLNTWLQRFCQQNKYGYLDYFSQMVDADGFLQQELADDGLHPNAAGYRVMAPLARRAIDSALRGQKVQKKRMIRFPF